MAAPLEKTRYPGIYKRGSRYVVRYRAEGVRHAETVVTLDEARRVKRAREAARDRGEHDLVTEGRVGFREYAEGWVRRYQGNGRRGFTEETRAEYVRDLERYAYPWLATKQLTAIRPRDIADWVAWLCDPREQGKRRAAEQRAAGKVKPVEDVDLSDATVRRILCPVRSCLATARREGLIRSNACDDVPLPNRPQIEQAGEEGKVKAMTREQLSMFLRIVPARWRLLFRFLAVTGMRWSEVAGLQWGDLTLEGSEAAVRVRRALARKQPKEGPVKFKPPKSKYGVRTIPLDPSICRELLKHREAAGDPPTAGLVFPAANGAPLRQENVRRRVLAVAAEEAGVPWIGFHAFRHTCASLLFANGRNVKQVQRWLGHHSPGFTLDTYVHLLDDGVGGGLDLGVELASAEPPEGESKVSPDLPALGGTEPEALLAEVAS